MSLRRVRFESRTSIIFDKSIQIWFLQFFSLKYMLFNKKDTPWRVPSKYKNSLFKNRKKSH